MIKINDTINGVLHVGYSGSGYLINENDLKDVFINKHNIINAFHLDTVKVKIISNEKDNFEGEVIEVIERFKTEYVGTIQVKDKYGFFVPDNGKIKDFYIPFDKLFNTKNGAKVVARLIKWTKGMKSPNAEIIRVIGNAGEHETEIHSILESYSLPYNFDAEVVGEAETISDEITQVEIDKRRDLRHITTCSIDPIFSRDADDTVGLEWINGECFVYINIADVTFAVRPKTELDKEAYARATSIYLIDRVIPMLPERLSNKICSLKSGSDKLSFSAIFKLDRKGNVLDRWFGRTIINVNKDYTYEEAQSVIDNGVREEYKETDKSILELNRMAKILRNKRAIYGSLELNNEEVSFKLDENNKPIEVIFKTQKDSNMLIEEFMLLANKEVASFIKSKGYPCVNRIHESPDNIKLESLKTFVLQFGYELKINTVEETKNSLNKLLEESKDKPEKNVISKLVTRTQQKAYYGTANIGHYGLGFIDYSHFTSPIRRYSDILTHRLLALALGNNGYSLSNQSNAYDVKKTEINIDKLEARCKYISEREKIAQKASRDSVKFMQCLYMKERTGKVFKGVVGSIMEFGAFIELIENKCDCLVKASSITGTWTADTANYCLKETNTGEMIRLGDEVHVVITDVDVEKKNINAMLIKL